MCKKIFALCLAAIMVCSLFALAGCKGGDTTNTTDATKSTDGGAAKVDYSKIKIGFIFLHDDKSTYDLNFMNAAKAAQEKGYTLYAQSPTNQVFVVLSHEKIAELEKNFAFEAFGHVDDNHEAMRFVCSWATKPEAVDALIESL